MSATPRSLEDARAKQALLAQYIEECERIDAYKSEQYSGDDVTSGRFNITREEMIEVFERRRDRIYNDLTNKGIKLHTETNDTLPSIAKAHAEMGQ